MSITLTGSQNVTLTTESAVELAGVVAFKDVKNGVVTEHSAVIDIAAATDTDIVPAPPAHATRIVTALYLTNQQPAGSNAITITAAGSSAFSGTMGIGDSLAFDGTTFSHTVGGGDGAAAGGNGGFSPPAAWTVDDTTGQFVLTFVLPVLGPSVPAFQVNQTGVPLDYTPMFWVGGNDPTLTGTQVFSIDSSGDADWEFRDSAVSLIFHRMHDGDDSQVMKIGESDFWVNNTAHHTNMLLADYDGDYLQLGAATSTLAFFATGGATKQTGVAVSAAGIHAALVAYGLITA